MMCFFPSLFGLHFFAAQVRPHSLTHCLETASIDRCLRMCISLIAHGMHTRNDFKWYNYAEWGEPWQHQEQQHQQPPSISYACFIFPSLCCYG